MAEEQKRRIVVDLSEWEFGEWPDELAKCVEVETTSYGDVEITLKLGDLHEAAVAKIGKEMIETFLNGDGTVAILGVDGVTLRASEVEGGERDICFPWLPDSQARPGPTLEVGSREMLNDLIEWLQRECNSLVVPFPPPLVYPTEGFAVVPRTPTRAMLDALYGTQPKECDMEYTEAVKAWRNALKAAGDV